MCTNRCALTATAGSRLHPRTTPTSGPGSPTSAIDCRTLTPTGLGPTSSSSPTRAVRWRSTSSSSAPAGFTLVELKYWAGPISGDRYRLVRGAQGDTFDNPFRWANAKARILRGQLDAAYQRITKRARRLVPLVPRV